MTNASGWLDRVQVEPNRPAVLRAAKGDVRAVEVALNEEEAEERALDRAYWRPLREELEQRAAEPAELGRFRITGAAVFG